MEIERKADRLILSTGAGAPWFSSLAIGLFVFGISGTILVAHVYEAIYKGWHFGWAALIICPLVMYSFGKVIIAACHATLEVDARYGQVLLERRFLSRTEREKFRLDDVAALEVEVSKDSDGDKQYQPVLRLTSGRRIELAAKSFSRAKLDPAVAAFEAARVK
ncbi:MAG: hypothetical protein ACKVP7_19065 [Hyphomicrobiaceae bacterium]